MRVQEFLRYNGLEALCQQFSIKAKPHSVYPDLIHLKYSQIDSPMGERVVQECRGLVLDSENDWEVVCRSFNKFFNHMEGHAATIDWTTAKAYEKLDGSLCTLYWFGGIWWIATTGTPDATGGTNRIGQTFAELFRETFRSLGYLEPQDRDLCYSFELMTKDNRIIVQHPEPRLVLHGIRNRVTQQEHDPAPYAQKYGWECVRSFPLGNFTECLEAAKQLNPVACEGYVVCDGDFNRVKVKSPQYVALSHMKEGMSSRRMLELVRTNESDEFLTYFPEWRVEYDNVRTAYDGLCDELTKTYDSIRHIEVQKDFALEACKTQCRAAMFAMRAGKCRDVKDFFAKATPQVLERVCKVPENAAVVPSE